MGELVSLASERIRRQETGDGTAVALSGRSSMEAVQTTQTNLAEFDDPHGTRIWSAALAGGGVFEVRESETRAPSTQRVSFDRLYPHKELLSPELQRLVSLLDYAISLSDTALFNKDEGDGLAAELVMQSCESTMAEVFAREYTSDNTAMVAQAIFYSIHNKGAEIFSREEIVEIRYALRQWKENVFLDISNALKLIDALERAGLQTEPVEFVKLRQLLSDESVS